MQKRTKIILASTAAVIFLAGAIGVSKAKEGFQKGFHGSSTYMKHGGFGGHRRGGHMPERLLEKFDVDKNGTITKAEIADMRQSELAKNDANKDGALSLNEFETLWTDLMRERLVDHFQRLDNNGDGTVTAAEIAKPMDRMMSFMDRNNDGALSKDELRRRSRGGHRGDRHHSEHKSEHRGHHDDHDDKK